MEETGLEHSIPFVNCQLTPTCPPAHVSFKSVRKKSWNLNQRHTFVFGAVLSHLVQIHPSAKSKCSPNILSTLYVWLETFLDP